MNVNNHQIPELIFKQYNRTISPSEEATLQAWVELSDRNKELYREITDSDNLTNALARHFAYDADGAWEKIQRKVAPKRFGRRTVVAILKYAAVVVPLLAGTVYMVNKSTVSESKNISVAEAVSFQPGCKKAILTLNNGEQVPLGEQASVTEIKLDSLHTAIDKDYSLVYTESVGNADLRATNTVTVPIGGEYQLVLPDGSKVWLNAQSQITFPVQFAENTRTVEIKGEAYFEVTHNPDWPFVVECSAYAVEVLGTSFNISDYVDESQSATTLVSGRVRIKTSAHELVLRPGEQAELQYASSTFSVDVVDVAHHTAWKDGLFSFRSSSLGSIMRNLSRWYGCEFQFQNSELENLHFTGTLDKHQNLKDLLTVIAGTCSVDFSLNNNKTIIVSSK